MSCNTTNTTSQAVPTPCFGEHMPWITDPKDASIKMTILSLIEEAVNRRTMAKQEYEDECEHIATRIVGQCRPRLNDIAVQLKIEYQKLSPAGQKNISMSVAHLTDSMHYCTGEQMEYALKNSW